MQEPIYLITSNPWKVASFTAILEKYEIGIPIEMLNEEYPENKDEGTTERVVLDGAKYCAQKFNKKVIVQDTWLFIPSLHGFPWVNTKFAIQTIGNEGIIKLLEWGKDRAAQRIFSLWYCEPSQDPIARTWHVDGTVADALRWEKWFGFDPIFIPDGYTATFGEDPELRDMLSPFRETIYQLVEYLRGAW